MAQRNALNFVSIENRLTIKSKIIYEFGLTTRESTDILKPSDNRSGC